MVDNVLDSIGTQGIIERNRDQIVGVAAHLGNEPLGATVRPDTERPAVELLVAQDNLVQVHDSASKGIDALVDLAVGLPGVATIGLSNGVEGAVAQEVVVGILCHRWSITAPRRKSCRSSKIWKCVSFKFFIVSDKQDRERGPVESKEERERRLTVLPHIVEGLDVRGITNVVDQGIGIGGMSVMTCCGCQLMVIGIQCEIVCEEEPDG